jgi:hypothetical protein
VKGDPKTGYFPDNSNVYLKNISCIFQNMLQSIPYKNYTSRIMALHGIPITVYVIVQIKDFQNREEGTTQEGRIDTKKQ